MFDTILRGGTVIDGTGRPAFPADVGITGGTITAVGDLSAAAAGRTMDVAGRTVTPGFIDIHTPGGNGIDGKPIASVSAVARVVKGDAAKGVVLHIRHAGESRYKHLAPARAKDPHVAENTRR